MTRKFSVHYDVTRNPDARITISPRSIVETVEAETITDAVILVTQAAAIDGLQVTAMHVYQG